MKYVFYTLQFLCAFWIFVSFLSVYVVDNFEVQGAILLGKYNYFLNFGIPGIGIFLFYFLAQQSEKSEDKKVQEKSKNILDKF
tara:strand:+ start:21 stop:269 length:249 start_codon:yes stop_codon:yes gene_type:complete